MRNLLKQLTRNNFIEFGNDDCVGYIALSRISGEFVINLNAKPIKVAKTPQTIERKMAQLAEVWGEFEINLIAE
jgi:hypothetical protein